VHHAFVSYARLDSDFVEEVVARLRELGRDVWIDRRDIPVSFSWVLDVREAIAAADLVLEFRSPNQAASDSCALESAAAEELGKETFGVDVGTAPEAAVREITAAIDRLGGEDRGRTELLVRSQAWDRQGRPRRSLPSRRPTRRLVAAARSAPLPMPALAERFLRSARRRNRRRRLLAALGLSVIGISVIAIALVPRVQKEEDKRLDEIELSFADSRFAELEAETDVYQALHAGARKLAAGSRSFLHLEPLQTALDVPVPDRFSNLSAGPPIAATAAGSAPTAISGGGMRAVSTPRGGVVSVFDTDEELATRLWADTPPTALAFSPDERLIAVGEGSVVGIFDLETGARLESLRGSSGIVRGLRWSPDGSRLWALVGRSSVASWPWRTARVLLDRPDLQFVDLSAPSGNREIAVSKDGRIALLESGKPARVLETGAGEVVDAAFADDLVALGGASEVFFYDLSSGRERSIPLDCLVAGVAFSTDGSALYASCVNSGVRAFDTRTLRQLADIPVEGGALRLAPLPSGDVVVGTPQGFAALIPADGGEPEQLIDAMRGEALFAVVASADGKRVLLGGLGTGKPFSTFSGWQDSGGWHWDTPVDTTRSSGYAAKSGAFSADDRLMALGLRNGRILIHSLGKDLGIGPVWSDLPGSITGLSFDRRGRLLAATSEGIVAVYDDPCPDCERPRALAELAEDRYRHAVRIGLAEPGKGPGWWHRWRQAVVQLPNPKP
jgi:WD40 repeat protein